MKKNLLSIIILALIVVNIAMTGFMLLSVMTTNSQTAKLVSDIAAALELETSGGMKRETRRNASGVSPLVSRLMSPSALSYHVAQSARMRSRSSTARVFVLLNSAETMPS